MHPPNPRRVGALVLPAAAPTSHSVATVAPPAQTSRHHLGGGVDNITLTYADGNDFAWYEPYIRWMTLVDHPLDVESPLYGPHALDDHPRRFPMARRPRRQADTPGSTTNPLPPPIPKITVQPNPVPLGAPVTIRCAGLIDGDQLDLGNGVTVTAVAEQIYTYLAAGTWVIKPLRAGAPVQGATFVAVEVQPAPDTSLPVGISVTPSSPLAGQTATIVLTNLKPGDTVDYGDTVTAPAQVSQSHIWNAGSYPLRVLRGGVSVASTLVVVQPDNTPAPTPTFDITPRDGTSTQVRTASSTAYPPGTRVAWGDGTFTQLQGSTALHTYPVGTYTAALVDAGGTPLPGVPTYSVTSTTPPPPPPSGPSAYVEPADPWTAYQWNDSVGASSTGLATLEITVALLDKYASIATDPFDGIAKWRLDFRNLPPEIRNPRNMVTGRRAIYVNCGNRWLWGVHAQAMSVGGPNTSRGIIGCAGDSLFTFTDSSLYGPHLHMSTGQWAGSVHPEAFKHAELRQVNLERTQGFKPANARLGDNDTQGVVMRLVRARNTNGQIRDTTTASGFKPGSQLHVDREVANLIQIASSTLRRIDIYAVVSYQDPNEPNYIEDTGNFYNVKLYGKSGLTDVADLILCHGAFPMNRGSDYSGGGVIIDGDGTRGLRIHRVFAVETSNYGIAHAGGGDNEYVDCVAYQTGKVNGIVADTTPDTGSYDREYYGTEDQSGRKVTNFDVGWGTPTSSNPNRRQDGPGNGTTSRGTVYSGVTRYNGGTGAILQAVVDSKVARFYDLVGAQIIGRLNPM